MVKVTLVAVLATRTIGEEQSLDACSCMVAVAVAAVFSEEKLRRSTVPPLPFHGHRTSVVFTHPSPE